MLSSTRYVGARNCPSTLEWDATPSNNQWLYSKVPSLSRTDSVGGIVVPVDKFSLLAPYIGLASMIALASVATAIYVKRVKRRKEKQ